MMLLLGATNFTTSQDTHSRNQQKIAKEEGPKKGKFEKTHSSEFQLNPKLLKPQKRGKPEGNKEIRDHP